MISGDSNDPNDDPLRMARVNQSEGGAAMNVEDSITPGPWKAEQVDMDGDDPNRWSVLTSGLDRDYFVATVENGAPGDSLATEEANARLMASAPEMLEVLREVALPPYSDSDLSSLLNTLRTRAASVLARIRVREVPR